MHSCPQQPNGSNELHPADSFEACSAAWQRWAWSNFATSSLVCHQRHRYQIWCANPGGADSSLQLGGACGMEGLVQWVKCKNYKNNAMCNGQRHLVPNCTLIQTFVFHWRLFLGLQHNWWLAAWLCTKEKSYEAVQGHQAEDFWWFQACSSVRTLDA